MPTIKFTATPELPFDIAHLGYKAGDVLEMNDASARRWVRRGVAVYLPEAERRLSADGLRLDGPTVWAYIHAGYRADAYPPVGYASQSTEEEIARAKEEEEKYFSAKITNGEMTANEVRVEIGLPALPSASTEQESKSVGAMGHYADGFSAGVELATSSFEGAVETALNEAEAVAIADVDVAEDGTKTIVAIDEPKRRGRKAKVVGDVD